MLLLFCHETHNAIQLLTMIYFTIFFLLLPLERAIKRAGTWFAGTCQYTICCSHLSDRVGIPLPLGDTSPPTPQLEGKSWVRSHQKLGLPGKLESPRIPLTFNYVFLIDLFPDIRRSEPYIGFMII